MEWALRTTALIRDDQNTLDELYRASKLRRRDGPMKAVSTEGTSKTALENAYVAAPKRQYRSTEGDVTQGFKTARTHVFALLAISSPIQANFIVRMSIGAQKSSANRSPKE